jgi:hypothetical protein
VLEAGFLILLAVVVGLADLRPALIVLVMGVGWLLVALIEYFAWRQTAGLAAVDRQVMVEDAPPPVVHEEVEELAPPPPPPTPQPVEEETIVAPPQAEPPPAEDAPSEAEEPKEFLPERHIPHRLEPLKPRPPRRWKIVGPRVRREGDSEEER